MTDEGIRCATIVSASQATILMWHAKNAICFREPVS